MYTFKSRPNAPRWKHEERRVTKMTPRVEVRPPKPQFYAIAYEFCEDGKKHYVTAIDAKFRSQTERRARGWAHSKGYILEAVHVVRPIQRKSGVQPKRPEELWAEKMERKQRF